MIVKNIKARDTRKQTIHDFMSALYCLDRAQVRDQVAANHRVSDLDGVSKGLLISMALEDRFGRRAMTAFAA